MSKSIEFGVVNVERRKNIVSVEGRCHRGPILPGQMFTSISEMVVQTSQEVVGPATLTFLNHVELKVESIWAYGRQIEELSPSMTARLELSGQGIRRVLPGLVLS